MVTDDEKQPTRLRRHNDLSVMKQLTAVLVFVPARRFGTTQSANGSPDAEQVLQPVRNVLDLFEPNCAVVRLNVYCSSPQDL